MNYFQERNSPQVTANHEQVDIADEPGFRLPHRREQPPAAPEHYSSSSPAAPTAPQAAIVYNLEPCPSYTVDGVSEDAIPPPPSYFEVTGRNVATLSDFDSYPPII